MILEDGNSYNIDFHEDAPVVKRFVARRGFMSWLRPDICLRPPAGQPVKAERSEFIDRALTGWPAWRIHDLKGEASGGRANMPLVSP